MIDVIDGAEGSLGELLVEALTDPEHIRMLFDHVPEDVLPRWSVRRTGSICVSSSTRRS